MALLPLIVFILLSILCYRSMTGEREVRTSLLRAALIWGFLVTLNTEVLSLFHLYTRPAVALFWILIGVMAGIALSKTQDPELSSPKGKSSSPADDVLNLSIVGVIGMVGLVALIAPPNNWDSMTYHMSRVAHWIQNRSVAFFPTSMPRQLWASPWAEYAIGQLQLLSLSDRFANMVQWMSMVLSVAGTSLIAKALGASRRGQIVSALLTATLPVGILEASSTQNDYTLALWLVCFIFFGLRILETPRYPDTLFWSLALGLALLTKSTAIMFCLPFAAWILLEGLRRHAGRFIPAVIFMAAISLTVNIAQYMRTYQMAGNIFSLPSESKSVRNQEPTLQTAGSTALRYIGLNLATPSDRLNKGIEQAIVWIHERLKWDPADPRYTLSDEFRIRFSRHEDSSCNTAITLIFLAAIVQFFRRQKSETLILSYWLAWMGAFLFFCFLLKWQPWGNRLLLPLAVASTPWIALVIDRRHPSISPMISLLVLAVCLPWIFKNTSRPLIDREHSIFTTNRLSQYFANVPGMAFSYQRAAEEIQNSHCSRVGLLMTTESWEYPLWALLNEPRKNAIRLEHVNVPNPSAAYDKTLAPFDPCLVIADGDTIQETQITVKNINFTKTNQWGYLALFRKDPEGKIGAFARTAHLNNLLNLSRSTDAAILQAQTNGGLDQKIATQIVLLRQNALNEAKQLNPDDINRLYPGLGTAIQDLFIEGSELFLKGISGNDPDSINRGQDKLNGWNAWLRAHAADLQNVIP